MPRRARVAPGGLVYHVLNRGVGRMALFEKEGDYAAFEACLRRAGERDPGVRLLAYCLMPNHWHLLLWPTRGASLAAYMQRLTLTHTRRWQEHRHLHGTGHVYQGRYKSFPVETDEHFLSVARYVERNPLRANLVERAQDWLWDSLSCRQQSRADEQNQTRPILSAWPMPEPRGWLSRVNRPQSVKEEQAIRRSLTLNHPYGNEPWTRSTTHRLNLPHTPRPRGRPRRETQPETHT